jgi:serine/threonine protein kinase
MAEVFKAKISSTHGFEKQLVIKRILPNLAADRTFVSMFIDEAKLTAQLIHPKIVQVIDFGEVNGQYFIALEFIDGFDALALLRGSAGKQIRLPMPICMFIAMEVLDALDYAHHAKDKEGRPMRLVHRDISPSNVFLARRGDVKLGDFGIAHATERESKTQAGTLKGKYGYMSPEQVMGGALDARSDLFAVGILLSEMLMGRRLFTAANDLDVLLMVRDGRLERLDKYARDMPPSLNKIVRKALNKDLEQRYQSAAEFRDALGDLLFQSGVRVTPSHIGRISADFLDPSAEASARLRAELPRWQLSPGGQRSGNTPGPAVINSVGSVPRAPANAEGTIDIDVDDVSSANEHDLNLQAGGGGSNHGAILDQVLSGPMSVVDLDAYSAPAARTPAGTANPGGKVGSQPAQPAGIADLSTISTMRIFCDLAVGGETGLLRVESGSRTQDIYLARGAPDSVASNAPGERLPDWLVAIGAVRSENMRRALEHLPQFGGKLPDTLVSLSLLSGTDMAELLARRIRDQIQAVFALQQGQASFFRGVRNPEGGLNGGLEALPIVGTGVLALPIEVFRRRFLPLLDQRPMAVSPLRIEPTQFQLGPTPRDLWNMLDGNRTIRDWVGGCASVDEQVTFLRTLYLLTETGLARII